MQIYIIGCFGNSIIGKQLVKQFIMIIIQQLTFVVKQIALVIKHKKLILALVIKHKKLIHTLVVKHRRLIIVSLEHSFKS